MVLRCYTYIQRIRFTMNTHQIDLAPRFELYQNNSTLIDNSYYFPRDICACVVFGSRGFYSLYLCLLTHLLVYYQYIPVCLSVSLSVCLSVCPLVKSDRCKKKCFINSRIKSRPELVKYRIILWFLQ